MNINEQMDEKLIKKIFQQAGLGEINSIQKIEVGFSNDVYSVDDKYILKVCKSKRDDEYLRKDVYFCNLFKKILPVPQVIYTGTSKKMIDKVFFIYPKIRGDNLYNKWHLYDENQRKGIIKQICKILRKINETPYGEFVKEFDVDTSISLKERICAAIDEGLAKVGDILPADIVDEVKRYVNENGCVLEEEKMCLVYWDVHFDNFIVDEGEIVGILDFERMYLSSMDCVLDLIRRMVRYPKKYASEEAEAYVEAEDYAKLMDWYKEFYPELFEFEDLDKRLNLYGIEHALSDIFYFPDVKGPREELEACLDH